MVKGVILAPVSPPRTEKARLMKPLAPYPTPSQPILTLALRHAVHVFLEARLGTMPVTVKGGAWRGSLKSSVWEGSLSQARRESWFLGASFFPKAPSRGRQAKGVAIQSMVTKVSNADSPKKRREKRLVRR